MWCDASSSVVKIAKLASPHSHLFPSNNGYGRIIAEKAVCCLCDRFAGTDTVWRHAGVEVSAQRQGLQAHDH